MNSSVLFVAGDISGDEHAARVARLIGERHPAWQLHAVGGRRLAEAATASPGGTLVGDSRDCAVIGFASAMAILPRLIRLHRRVVRFLEKHRPNAVLLCDWGAFNGRLLPDLKRLGIPVLYYFPPRSWQRDGAAGLGIVPYVARVATPFSWSAAALRGAGATVEWVGHPALETAAALPTREVARQELGVPADCTLIGLFPGSRALELQYIAPHVIAAAKLLNDSRRVRFAMAIAPEVLERHRFAVPDFIQSVPGGAGLVLRACDAAIVKSGTITLEAALIGAPQVVVYDTPLLLRWQWQLTGLTGQIPFVAMPNIILGKMAVPELLSDRCRPPAIAAAIGNYLDNPATCAAVRGDYELVRQALGSDLPFTATDRTAAMLEDMLS